MITLVLLIQDFRKFSLKKSIPFVYLTVKSTPKNSSKSLLKIDIFKDVELSTASNSSFSFPEENTLRQTYR